jgi:hypothetical protein
MAIAATKMRFNHGISKKVHMVRFTSCICLKTLPHRDPEIGLYPSAAPCAGAGRLVWNQEAVWKIPAYVIPADGHRRRLKDFSCDSKWLHAMKTLANVIPASLDQVRGGIRVFAYSWTPAKSNAVHLG